MSKNWRYLELNKISHLPNSGRELLGKQIYWEEKRDGSCIAIWLERILEPWYKRIFDRKKYKLILRISSRNKKIAQNDIQNSFFDTNESHKIEKLLRENPFYICFIELLIKGKSPTRIETHEKNECIGFDIFDLKQNCFLSPINAYQIYYHYSIPFVRFFGESRHTSMKSLWNFRNNILKLCQKEGREGVVLKTFYSNGTYIYAKEKIDTPQPIKLKIEKGRVQYPPLPDSEAQGAVDKVFADLGSEKFADKNIAMPLVAQYIQEEMKKHQCSAPAMNFYYYYTRYCEDRGIKQTKQIKQEKQPKQKLGVSWDRSNNRIYRFLHKIYCKHFCSKKSFCERYKKEVEDKT